MLLLIPLLALLAVIVAYGIGWQTTTVDAALHLALADPLGHPLAGAEVRLLGTDQTETTDGKGRAAFVLSRPWSGWINPLTGVGGPGEARLVVEITAPSDGATVIHTILVERGMWRDRGHIAEGDCTWESFHDEACRVLTPARGAVEVWKSSSTVQGILALAEFAPFVCQDAPAGNATDADTDLSGPADPAAACWSVQRLHGLRKLPLATMSGTAYDKHQALRGNADGVTRNTSEPDAETGATARQ